MAHRESNYYTIFIIFDNFNLESNNRKRIKKKPLHTLYTDKPIYKVYTYYSVYLHNTV